MIFFSRDEEIDHRFFGTQPTLQLNGTSFIVDFFDPQAGFSNFISDNGIRVSEIVHSHAKVSFKAVEAIEIEEKADTDNTNSPLMITENESDTIDDLQLFVKRFEVEHHETTALLFLLGVLSASYAIWLIFRQNNQLTLAFIDSFLLSKLIYLMFVYLGF